MGPWELPTPGLCAYCLPPPHSPKEVRAIYLPAFKLSFLSQALLA